MMSLDEAIAIAQDFELKYNLEVLREAKLEHTS